MFSLKGSQAAMSRRMFAIFLALAIVACLFVGESMAGGKGNKGGEDIILYNGNIVLRGGGGKGKGKGGGSIVVANSPQHQEYMPMFGGWGGYRR